MAGRAGVRAAIQTQIQSAGITFVGTVYAARPTILQEQDYEQTMSGQAVAASANGSNCVIVVNLLRTDRQREANVGRPAVNDRAIHTVTLELFFASTCGTAIKAQQDYDTIVDALIVNIRANPTPGGGGVVWSAGEFRAGVKHAQTVPASDDTGLTITINGAVTYEAIEWLAGTDV